MKISTDEIKRERERLVKEKDDLLKRLEVLSSNILLLDKFCGNGKREPTPRLNDAAQQVMQAVKRFTMRELADQIRQRYPAMDFSEKSVAKPLQTAIKGGQVKLVQPNIGSKTQAIYEWVKD